MRFNPRNHFSWVTRARYDGLHRHFDHRSDECGWQTVSCDVRHQEAYPLPIDGNEFIEIASDGTHIRG
jgi:hypothetical protein